MHVGKIIHKFRKDKKMTLGELSKRSGVALATLSRIENGIMTGTLPSHMSIAKALDVNLLDLYKDLPAVKKTVEVKTTKDRQDVFVHNARSSSEMLVSKAMEKKMMPILLKIQKGGSTHKEETRSGIEKFIYLLDGVVEAVVGDEKYSLKKGDTLYFEASQPHQFKNTGKAEAKIISVVSPPAL